MSEWKTYKLGEIANITTGFPFKGNLYSSFGTRVLRGENIGDKVLRWDARKDKRWNEPFEKTINYMLHAGDIVLAMDGNVGKNKAQIKLSDLPMLLAQRVACIRNNKYSDQKFLYYILISKKFTDYLNSVKTGTTIQHISMQQIADFIVSVPSLEEQRRIAAILGALDDKIELNRRINANLEQQAQTLFKYYFIDNTNLLGITTAGNLTDIAQYLNGLAMQKFRPKDNESAIPVLKIKELGQGQCDESSDLCSSVINSDYIVSDGDIIFSWSGTLLVDIWCGGKCGLNQHLFKVTSKVYPKWFIYYWTKYHLDKFIRIAKDKAVTMGHIKRCDLETSAVLIPPKDILTNIDALISPILDCIIKNRIENRKLSQLRDTLLPKLMSGEMKI